MAADELRGGAHLQPLVRMDIIVVLEPVMEQGEDSSGIGTIVQIQVITLEGIHERLSEGIGLGVGDRRETRDHVQRVSLLDDVAVHVAAAVVGQSLDRIRYCRSTEDGLHRLDYQVPNRLARDSGGRSDAKERLAVTRMQHESETDLLAVPAGVSKVSEHQRSLKRKVMILLSWLT